MNFNEFKDKLFEKAKKEGFSEYEVYYVNGQSLEVTAYQKAVDQYSVNDTIGLSFRGLYNGKMGYSYTEVLDTDAVDMLVKSAKDNAVSIENEDIEIIYDGGNSQYGKVSGYNKELTNVGPDKKIELALDMEQKTLQQSDKVKGVEYCVVESAEGETKIVNSKGLDLSYKSNAVYGVIVPVVQQENSMNSGIAYSCGNKFEDINADALAKEAVEDALAYIGAQSVKSGKYKVALRNDMALTLLETFSDIFSSENTQKGLSLLKGKTGSVIGSDILTIVDDPLLEGGLSSCPFDAEGVASYTKDIVKNGKLMTLLYNLKTAYKDHVKTTGNASKASYSSPVDISPSNFYIKPGTKSREQLLKDMGDGIFITDLQGMHSGASSISGDFSLAAKGFAVRNGEIKEPVEQITIAGNFYDVMKNVIGIASDLRYGMPTSAGTFGSPTVLINEMSVAGK